ncbi:glycosyltransferase family 2 protein [Fuscibacter oryzae]|uniref:Glycosyltransferase family 2 protein n=1 Tax=Fuscibacter oryzae TaxID=2803939 RepID=A0A8J7MQ63_9RHOB|nr:glycosyltransferase family 2 protein [Fuscibacter oryzae]MBL4927763.1 glycosyltransferase family 2 protein [Fuscibacter oryzae]
MTGPRFSCLIPAWNEGPRIGAVLAAIDRHPRLDQVIVIDDGSTDDTAEIARAHGVTVLQTPGNLGKTQALLAGLAQASGSHLVLIDADLTGLTAADIDALIAPVATGRAFASLSLRGNAPRTWRALGLDYISGERVIPRALIAGQESALARLPRFGFEVFLNRQILAQGGKVAVVRWPDVASPAKSAKRGGLWQGIKGDVAMMRDIFATVPITETLHQIIRLRQRAV